ncbi:hypothetical protein LOC51_25435 [Rubrivivax sp. JA1024]|nr:hypothetical protein [Rubrivivax sp. JA1024]
MEPVRLSREATGRAVSVWDLARRHCILRATLDLKLVRGPLSIWTKPRSEITLALFRGRVVCGLATGIVGGAMRLITGMLAAVLLIAGVASSQAMVRIADDRGGRIGTYVDKYQSLRSSGETVMIDGLCASACTIVLGAVPHDKICVTSRANLGFHAAWDLGSNGRAITNTEATQMLYTMYPVSIRRWIAKRGGLTRHMIFLRGKQLLSMYRPCYMDAQAQAGR